MSRPKLPPDFVKLCQTVTAKRPKTVITHILKHGFITTQDLKDKYGYNHPPRAVRDVKSTAFPSKCSASKAMTVGRLPRIVSAIRAKRDSASRLVEPFWARN